MAFAIFAEHVTDDYKRTVIYLTFSLIKNNPDIMPKTIYWKLGKYIKEKKHIDWALSCLSTNIFSAAIKWIDDDQAAHYKIKNCQPFDRYIAGLVEDNPALLKFKTCRNRK